ncbi:MAG: hypothetical protein ACI3ZQ_02830 [Candidatus Cryptobacteroides sp.]
MKLKLSISFLMICICLSASAEMREGRHLTFGVEGDYVVSFLDIGSFAYIPVEGFRVVEQPVDWKYLGGFAYYAHIGYDITRNLNISFYGGYSSCIYNMVPMSLRLSFYGKENRFKDRWFGFVDAGSGLSIQSKVKPIICGKIGCGYSFTLSGITSLELLFSLNGIYLQPDARYVGSVDESKLFKSHLGVISASFGIGLKF